MSISGDYAHPVTVNGFTCKNCTDVDYAKKHIDPTHPKSGPYGVNADADPSVKFGGNLSHLNQASVSQRVTPADATSPGQSLNIRV